MPGLTIYTPPTPSINTTTPISIPQARLHTDPLHTREIGLEPLKRAGTIDATLTEILGESPLAQNITGYATELMTQLSVHNITKTDITSTKAYIGKPGDVTYDNDNHASTKIQILDHILDANQSSVTRASRSAVTAVRDLFARRRILQTNSSEAPTNPCLEDGFELEGIVGEDLHINLVTICGATPAPNSQISVKLDMVDQSEHGFDSHVKLIDISNYGHNNGTVTIPASDIERIHKLAEKNENYLERTDRIDNTIVRDKAHLRISERTIAGEHRQILDAWIRTDLSDEAKALNLIYFAIAVPSACILGCGLKAWLNKRNGGPRSSV